MSINAFDPNNLSLGPLEAGPLDMPAVNEAKVASITAVSVTHAPGAAPGKRMRLGEQLLDAGVITSDQLNIALKEKMKTGQMLGEQLVSLGFVSSSFLQSFLAEASGVEQFDPSKTMVDPEAVAKVPKDVATRLQILPVTFDDKVVVIATVDPHDVVVQDKLRQYFPRGTVIKPLLCAPKILADAIDSAYGYATSVDAILQELETGQIDLSGVGDEQSYAHPIVRLINALVYDAVKMGASDLHFEPEENFVRLRLRIDGVLREVQTFHKEYWNAMGQRMKIVSDMNIADKLNPQDGRFNLTVGGRTADFRVSSLPTVHGENFVLRVLDKSAGIKSLSDLGFSDHNLKQIKRSIARPEGVIIVTGPTGSGKTTTLYSMLNAVNSPEVNIMTLEDPVEYSLPLIRQSAVREATGLTFANGVKSLLRQDPDIIFIGEVRDGPTAEQALKAAMTGHQVFTTLHTNDCFGALPRLIDLGLKPGMVAGAIIASFAQRLVRRLCPECKKPAQATEEECQLLGLDPKNPPVIYHPVGCVKCGQNGYKGRLAIAEILVFDEELDDIVANNGHKSALKQKAMEKGFIPMAEDGVQKILQGHTTLQSLMKVVNLADRLG
ncbi:MAG: type secretory pathway, ATPase PulE/Tfp pilus assembly pathway, ATPase PilB [Alphaproteobacteria bacterium]|nr:type secretory pathway, ATPase PulE/Tfp pilus assembly pathway, ATPase PilB [Alphaproteobacteria bacterium]